MTEYDAIENAHDLTGDLLEEWPLFRSGEYPAICRRHAEELVFELAGIDRAAEWHMLTAEVWGEEE